MDAAELRSEVAKITWYHTIPLGNGIGWSGHGWGTKAGFDLARRALGSNVEDLDVDVLDLSPEIVGVFDIVLFLGVLYHLKHSMLALERLFSVTGERLIMSTFVDLTWRRKPAMAFYPGAEANDDPTNWWGPNSAAVIAMLGTAGFRKVEVVDTYAPLKNRLVGGLHGRLKRGQPLLGKLWQGAIVCHAWK